MTIDLRALVRAELEDSDEPDPHDLADAIIKDLKPAQYKEALTQTLHVFVRYMISDRKSNGRRRSNRSAKRDAIREAWRLRLRDREYVGGEWKFWKDLTHDELLLAAEQHRDIAKRNEIRADELDHLAKLVERHGVETVQELPEEALRVALGGDEAAA